MAQRDNDDDLVLSDVHMETSPPAADSWSTRFWYSLLQQHQQQQQPLPATAVPAVDSDGDVLPCRKPRREHSLVVHHSLATPISRCGEQVWPGACLLADWVLAHRQQLLGQTLVELGAGVGLVSLLAGRFASTVFLTDVDPGALALAQRNVAEQPQHADSSSTAQAAAAVPPDIRVRALDWFALFDTQLQQLPQADVLELLNSSTPQQQQPQQQAGGSTSVAAGSTTTAQWCPADLEALARTACWLAADVVYDQALTDAYLHTLTALMRWQQQQPGHEQQQQPKALVALEKRYNFTLVDMDATAAAFDHFLGFVAATEDSLAGLPPQEQQRYRQQQQEQQERRPLFRGRRLDVQSLPQSLQYDRSAELELWELTLLPADTSSS